ncbi:beta-mannosidase [Flavobacterium lacisediminis]|uniref:Beta-mannosidase B n=1 Tax=Flavobacterium lacisediminis TaxID=2989705 RepID=A0ABT3EHS4_9FLAO|nr:glycoside hydrolase family 2 protein [Flavobacterium lacisediminis]MCW1148129.1 glycoside hydrolase family 2 protein [Flavobacterium lacisediminis]
MFKKIFVFILCLNGFFIFGQTFYRNLSSENWTFNKQNEAKKHKATIPGTVHTDLFQNQLIPDPFFGANEKKLQWIENENWEYETYFTLSESELKNQNIDLEFEGLDTYATIFLNGKVVLEADNMFRKWTISAKSHLKIGTNHLKVVFQSAVQKGKEEAKKISYTLPEKERVFVRKAQCQFGWDWGPRFVTAGIWKKVQLKFWNSAKIESIKYSQIELNDKKAILEFTTEIYVAEVKTIQLKINKKSETFNLKKGKNKIKMQYEIANPKLWWCNGLGDANLYPFTIEIQQKNQLLDAKKLNIGLRTIELIQEKDQAGKSFYFKLNGKSVFMKGANMVPPDSFLPRVSDSTYFSLVENAKKANMNMLRVWGGGVYFEDAFYEACDANGILVWQDFMFACSMYPGDEKFVQNVKQEVIDNVNRLQNHPSIAIWCGNNENDEGWHNWGWQKQFKYTKADSTQIWNDYKKVFHEMIPKTLDSLLPKEKNIYWSSSPSIGWGRKESLLQGDSHYWGVWWGKEPFEIYEKKVGRFMSEYGFQGMPNLETLQKVIRKEDLNFTSEAFKNHQKHPTGYETINEYMERDFVVPKDFEDYAYVSQLLQARGMKTAIEAHRRAKPYCMGTLYWQFNDCWPVTSWSSLDYYGNWKAVHYQAKRSFENLLFSIEEGNDSYRICIVNDDLKQYSGELVIDLIDFSGTKLWNKKIIFIASENSSKIHFEIPKKDFLAYNLKQAVLSVSFPPLEQIYTRHYFFKPKDLQITKPNIQIKIINEETIEISSDVLAKDVFLSSENDTFFEDNYFDLLSNEKRIIKLSKPVQNIKVKSLFDTMK